MAEIATYEAVQRYPRADAWIVRPCHEDGAGYAPITVPIPEDQARFIAAALNARHSGALEAVRHYCATSPAIECEEGYWDDMESACADGERQEQSRAAAIMRSALQALGEEAPAGLETCTDCYHYADAPGRGIDHSSQCRAAEEDGDEEETFPCEPEDCPSKHWNRGDDICADCGTDLQA